MAINKRWYSRKVKHGKVKVKGRWYIPLPHQYNNDVMRKLEGKRYSFYLYSEEEGPYNMLGLNTMSEDQFGEDGYFYCMFWGPEDYKEDA